MIKINNKQGGTLTNWIFVISLMLLFLVILQTQVLTPMNEIYGKDYQTGLNTSGLDSLNSLVDSSDDEIQGAEATATSDGLSLTSAWTVGKGAYQTIVDFVSGSFISSVADALSLPPIVANTLIVMIWLSLIMIIIYIFMKVVP
jgi:hypothetical protein